MIMSMSPRRSAEIFVATEVFRRPARRRRRGLLRLVLDARRDEAGLVGHGRLQHASKHRRVRGQVVPEQADGGGRAARTEARLLREAAPRERPLGAFRVARRARVSHLPDRGILVRIAPVCP